MAPPLPAFRSPLRRHRPTICRSAVFPKEALPTSQATSHPTRQRLALLRLLRGHPPAHAAGLHAAPPPLAPGRARLLRPPRQLLRARPLLGQPRRREPSRPTPSRGTAASVSSSRQPARHRLQRRAVPRRHPHQPVRRRRAHPRRAAVLLRPRPEPRARGRSSSPARATPASTSRGGGAHSWT
ncbi:hypothetical protein HU200_066533 [Digitaria exilis]|uniref:Uncharacterized protein n=1 Tax=Digitaria exilis TaxID=1010633 RepID=A0A835DWK6_9POAL|nr:hypothetical protein HU200_066533 [Digitaria exilis]